MPVPLSPDQNTIDQDFSNKQSWLVYSWILGVLSGSGNLDFSGEIRLKSIDLGFVQTFATVFSTHFDLLLTEKSIQAYAPSAANRKINYSYRFRDEQIVDKYFGDLNKQNWATTFTQQHSWILSNSSFSAQFLAGYFDGNGSMSKTGKRPKINFSVSTAEGANILKNLLEMIGVPQSHNVLSQSKHITSVQILNQAQIAVCIDALTSTEICYKKNELLGLREKVNVKPRSNINNFVAYELAFFLHQKNVRQIDIVQILKKYDLPVSPGNLSMWLSGKKSPYNIQDVPVNPELIKEKVEKIYFLIRLSEKKALKTEVIGENPLIRLLTNDQAKAGKILFSILKKELDPQDFFDFKIELNKILLGHENLKINFQARHNFKDMKVLGTYLLEILFEKKYKYEKKYFSLGVRLLTNLYHELSIDNFRLFFDTILKTILLCYEIDQLILRFISEFFSLEFQKYYEKRINEIQKERPKVNLVKNYGELNDIFNSLRALVDEHYRVYRGRHYELEKSSHIRPPKKRRLRE